MTGVQVHPLIGNAGAGLLRVANGIGDDALSAATPCRQYNVRDLLNHLLYWSPILELAARKQPVPADRPAEGELDLTNGDWREFIADQVERLATSWSDPAAWQGMTSIGRSDLGDLPASIVGSIVLMELAIHGWDLAQATGQSFECEDEDKVAEAVLAHLDLTVESGRRVGAFGGEVTVPPGASTLHHALGVSGRDPHWSKVGCGHPQ